MNRLKNIYLLFIVVLYCSCEKSVDLTSKLHLIMINNTNKKILKIVKSDVGTDTLVVYGADSASIKFKKITSAKTAFGSLGYPDAPLIEVKEEQLYNLSDTSMFIFQVSYTNYIGKVEKFEDSLYSQNIYLSLGEKSTDSNPIIISIFIFSDSIKSILVKDYTMLEKFKDYYKK